MKNKLVERTVKDGKIVINNVVFLPPEEKELEEGSKYFILVFYDDKGIKSNIYATPLGDEDAEWEEWKASGVRCDGGEQ